MHRTAKFIPYDPAYADQVAQAFHDVFTTPPWGETLSLNDARSQLVADGQRPGFGGMVILSGDDVVGFSWWIDISGNELNDRWRPRFAPKDQVPRPEGAGVFMMEFGVIAAMRNHGLGYRLLKDTLVQVEPNHDWIALNTQAFAHAGLALLKSQGFEELGLTGVQVPTRICLMKPLQR
ncbi:MAG: hypothetical protein ABI947_18000 [Chloroflexota bacterium]